MNHCRRCDSDYDKPGTCNCFAEQAAPNQWQPIHVWYPYIAPPPYRPTWIIDTQPPVGNPVITWGNASDTTTSTAAPPATNCFNLPAHHAAGEGKDWNYTGVQS